MLPGAMWPVYLQMEWDRLLIWGWRQDARMGLLIHRFLHEKVGIECDQRALWDVLKNWKRTPVHIGELTVPVRVFMARRFRLLNDRLWDGVSDVEALAQLRRSVADDYRDRAQLNKEKPWRLKRGARYRVSIRERDKSHDWNTVK